MRYQPSPRALTNLARLAAIVGVLLLPTALGAQKTWIVDANNGTGTNFTDLPAAFAKVADGDLVIVRAGIYKPGQLDKAIRLVAESGAIVSISSTDFLITGIGAGKACVIQGLRFQGGGLLASKLVRVQDNKGLIAFADVRVEIQNGSNGLYAKNTTAVTLSNCIVRPQLTVEESELSAARCTFGPYPNGPVTLGVSAYKARLDLAQCVATGFNGFGHAPSTWAMRVAQTSIVLRGDKNSSYLGGTYNNQPGSPSIIGNDDSTLLVDPAVVLSPAPVKISITKRQLPWLSAQGGKLGGTLDLEVYSPATHPYVLAVALPTLPFELPFGRQWLDIPTEIFLVFGKQGSTGFTKHSYPVPSAAAFRGLTLGFQALSGTTILDLTNPVVPVLY